MEHLETIYFLEWLAKKSGFSEDQILENMRPENQKWDSDDYISIKEFYKNNNTCKWVNKLFFWEKSFLKPDYGFWIKFYNKWYDLVKANEYNFEFSRYPIKDWKLIKPTEPFEKVKIKIKSKKLKI